VPAVHTQALAGRGETCSWMSAAAGASGDRVLASIHHCSFAIVEIVLKNLLQCVVVFAVAATSDHDQLDGRGDVATFSTIYVHLGASTIAVPHL